MNERDEELDALQQALSTPYIETPDEMDVPTGGNCWLDQSRACRSDCVAFNTQRTSASPDSQCLHLVHKEEVLAGQAAIIAGVERVLSQLVQLRNSRREDAPVPPPPKVM